MLECGAPIEKDVAGYSKPDFGFMEHFSHLAEPSEETMLKAVEILLHYKNTQLKGSSAFLEEAKATLEKRIAECGQTDTGIEQERYIPIPIKVCSKTNSGITFAFSEYIIGREIDTFMKISHGAKFLKGGKLLVKYEDLEAFREVIGKLGRYGYTIPDNADLSRPEATQDVKKEFVFRFLKKSGPGIEFSVTPGCDYIRHIVWDMKNSGIEFWRINCSEKKLTAIVKPKYKEEVKDYLSKCAVLDDYWSDRCGYNRFEMAYEDDLEQEEEVKEKEKYELVDISKSDLPFQPYPFQIEDAKKALSMGSALLGEQMGCGKTLIAIMIGESIPGKKLVVVPESLRINWMREIQTFRTAASVKIAYPKDKIFLPAEDWTIIGYSSVFKFLPEILKCGFRTLFCDEAHFAKAVTNYGSPASNRAKAVMAIAEKAEYVFPMTGTPMPSRNKDLYNILKMLDVPEICENSFKTYGITYCDGYQNNFGWDFTGSSNNEELCKILNTVMIRRLKREVLPNLIKQRQFIPLKAASREYAKLERDSSAGLTVQNFLAFAQTGRRVLSKAKVPDTVDFARSILETGEQVVIATEFRETLSLLMDAFGDDACRIEGGMTDREKQKSIDDFQSGRKTVCIINMVAAGVGITLTAASNLIVMDYDYTPGNMDQVEDRICRPGQEHMCTIYYMFAEDATLDSAFTNMISTKSDIISDVVDGEESTMDLARDAKKARSTGTTIRKLIKAFSEKKNA